MSEAATLSELQAADREGRRLANTEFEAPVVLQAGAGTGKTTALVARILVFALGSGWERSARALQNAPGATVAEERIAARVLRRIVAITFTDAAAAEMARRTGEAFLTVVRGEIPEGVSKDELVATGPERERRARALAGALDRLVVRTIHAFARRLLAAHPVEAGLHPGFEVDGEGLATAAVVREIFELRLRDAFAAPGDPVLLGLAARGVSMGALEEELLSLVQSGALPEWLDRDPFGAAELAALAQVLRETLEALCRSAGASLAAAKNVKVAAEVVTLAAAARDRLAALGAPSGVAGMLSLCEIVGEGLEPRVAHLAKWAKGDFTKSEERALSPEACASLAALSATLHPLVDWLAESDPALLDLARRALAPLLRQAREELRSRGILSYDDLLRDAARLLRECPAVRQRERDEIDQLLVDEFQDTNGLQCELVASLALDPEAKPGPGLFLVGDPKQSIYGWRGADLRAYDGFLDRVRSARGRFGRLTVNHRSVQPILDEVKRVIGPAMVERRGVQPAFEHLESSRRPPAGPAFEAGSCRNVEYWISRRLPPPEKGTKKPAATALEARAVARDMARLIRDHDVPAQRMALLLRGFGDVEEYLSALRDAGVPYAVARDRSYYRRREIADASALVRCILDPSDELALVALLRSSLAGVPDAALAPLWRAGLAARLAALDPADGAGWQALRSDVAAALREMPGDLPGLEASRGFEVALDFLLRALSLLRFSFQADPSDVFVARLRGLLLLEASEAARPAGAFRHANLERFFRDLDVLLAHGASPSQALRWLRQSAREEREAEEARPLEAAEQAVQVMSIHKAKGLTFDHTYVVQLHKASGARADAPKPAHAGPEGGGIALRLLEQRSFRFLAVEARARETEAAEHVRTLYVAMTRARDRLVLAGLWPEGGETKRDPRTHVSLLQDREGGAPDLDALAERVQEEGATGCESHGATWHFSERIQGSSRAAPAGGEASASRLARAGRDAVRLEGLRATARARQARRFGAAVTAEAHEAFREGVESGRDVEDPPSAGAAGRAPTDRVAGLVGTALHRALEALDPMLPSGAVLEAMRRCAGALLEAELEGSELDTARERVEDLLERFARSDFQERLRAVAPRIVARELAVLLAPADSDLGAVGYVAGAIDLVYRDAAGDGLVVADYKTDRVESEEEISRAAERHAAQGARYVQALQEALGLPAPPRFELWFLHAGRVVVASPGT